MKKIVALILALSMVFALCGCGKSETVKEVENAINQIGTVTISSKNAIEKAERLYNILTEKEKEQVENRIALSEARAQYNKLAEQEQARKRAEEEQKNALTDMEKAAVNCCQYLKDACYNSDSFQIKEITGVIHYNYSNRFCFKIEFTCMNTAGGYSKELDYMCASKSEVFDLGGMGANLYYKDWDKSIKENEKVSIDKNRIEDNLK